MRFADVARYFDTDPILDGYTGALLFHGQSASFDDSSADGATARRRVLSLAPGLTIPARRAVSLLGEKWLIGNGSTDGFAGSAIRQHYVMKRVTDTLAVLTPGQALAQAAGTAAYGHKTFLKDTVNSQTDSEYDAQYNIFMAPSEGVVKGTFFRDEASILYRVRNTYLPVEGLVVAQADTLDTDAFQSCVFSTGSYNPATEVTTAGTTTVNSIWLDTPKFYRFRHTSDSQIQAGDLALFVPTTISPVAGMKFTMLGAVWIVLTAQLEIDCWALHVRRA